MAEKWKTVFKLLHGKTPTKADYKVAPTKVQEELGVANDSNLLDEPRRGRKRPSVQLKRPETFSPIKKRSKVDLFKCRNSSKSPSRMTSLNPDAPLASISAQKKVVFDSSPQKRYFSPSQSSSEYLTSLKQTTSPRKSIRSTLLTTIESPSKLVISPLKPMLRKSPRKSLFTPEKPGQHLISVVPTTPIRSPRKPIGRAIQLQNSRHLLLASTEKLQAEDVEPEVIETFEDETSEIPDDIAREVPKGKKNLFRYNAKREAAKANGENFVRINMRKKTFVRGKVSAEAKRKLVRKQKWKAKFGGKKF